MFDYVLLGFVAGLVMEEEEVVVVVGVADMFKWTVGIW